MNAVTITYIIGTDDIGVGENEVENVEGFQAELEERLAETFPEAEHLDVVFDNGRSQARVAGLDWETEGDREDAMLASIEQIASDVWARGNWRDA